MSQLHRLLARQLEKFGLNESVGPKNNEEWAQLLSRISSHYQQCDEERYLLERSLDISSNEMRERYDKIKLLVSTLEVNQSVLKELLNEKPLFEVLNHFLLEVEKKLTGFRTALFSITESKDELSLMGAPSFNDKQRRIFETIPIDMNSCPCGRAAYFIQPYSYVESPNSTAEMGEDLYCMLQSLDVKSCHAFPLVNDRQEVVAVISLYSDRKIKLSPLDVEFMNSISKVVMTAFNYLKVKDELKKEQELAIVQSKLATLGEMAGTVAHEINNPLFVIQGYSDMLQASIDDKNVDLNELQDTCQQINFNVDRIARIVKTLKNYSRDATNDPYELSSFMHIINDSINLSSKKYPEVQLSKYIAQTAQELKIKCHPSEVIQVIINLLTNSFQAVKDEQQPWIKVNLFNDEQNIKLSIVDSGRGIDSNVLNRLFQPFFTTKPSGVGTGLGLSISRKIIEAHGGKLYYNSDNIENTEFVVELPYVKEAA